MNRFRVHCKRKGLYPRHIESETAESEKSSVTRWDETTEGADLWNFKGGNPYEGTYNGKGESLSFENYGKKKLDE